MELSNGAFSDKGRGGFDHRANCKGSRKGYAKG